MPPCDFGLGRIGSAVGIAMLASALATLSYSRSSSAQARRQASSRGRANEASTGASPALRSLFFRCENGVSLVSPRSRVFLCRRDDRLYLDYPRQQFRKRAWMEFRSDLDEHA